MRMNQYQCVLTRRRAALLMMAGVSASSLCTTGAAWAVSLAKIPLEVWKDPDCGCCQDWIDHMQANGFSVKAHDVAQGNASVRAQLGLPPELGSCHTAVVEGYLLEGHVPAQDVHRLLKEKPKALGLTVPGMPVGSPGMDGEAYAGRKDPFEVLLVTPRLMGSGVHTQVFAKY